MAYYRLLGVMVVFYTGWQQTEFGARKGGVSRGGERFVLCRQRKFNKNKCLLDTLTIQCGNS